MKEKTKENVDKAFVGEAKAYFRLLAYVQKAEEEEIPQMALLFRAIADAESFHAKLYDRAIYQMIKKVVKAYHVCQVCRYVTDKKKSAKCPVYGAPEESFKTIGEE